MTLAADEAIPIPDSTVRIRGVDKSGEILLRTVFTDSDGVTSVVELPAPSPELSLDPSFNGAVSGLYDVTVVKEGYYSKVIRDVEVFADRLSILSVSMIPTVPYSDGGSIPRDNLIITN